MRPYGVCSAGSVFLYSSHQPARGSGDRKGRPYGDIWIFQPGPRARSVRPYGEKRAWDVGSETAGAEAEPQQL